ncbi:hypothetical protein KM043_000327 [Ampulex compressa]|nr:hypothetical protein KM043_000327 [Ampulex compressa]
MSAAQAWDMESARKGWLKGGSSARRIGVRPPAMLARGSKLALGNSAAGAAGCGSWPRGREAWGGPGGGGSKGAGREERRVGSRTDVTLLKRRRNATPVQEPSLQKQDTFPSGCCPVERHARIAARGTPRTTSFSR